MTTTPALCPAHLANDPSALRCVSVDGHTGGHYFVASWAADHHDFIDGKAAS